MSRRKRQRVAYNDDDDGFFGHDSSSDNDTEVLQKSITDLGHYSSKLKNFGTNQYVNKFSIKNLGSKPEVRLMKIFDTLIERAYDNARKEYNGREPDFYEVLIDGYGLTNPIIVHVEDRMGGNDVQMIMNEIDKLAQSEKFFPLIDNAISVIITTVSPPKGGGNLMKKALNVNFGGFNEDARLETGMGAASLCLFYAVEIARIFHDQTEIYQRRKQKDESPISTNEKLYSNTYLKKLLEFDEKGILREEVHGLLYAIGVPRGQMEYSIGYLSEVQRYYDEIYPDMYRIVCVEANEFTQLPTVVWRGPIGRKYEVSILAETNHFTALKSVSRYFRLRRFCIDCEIPFSTEMKHTYHCKARCYWCSRVKFGACVPQRGIAITCTKCSRIYKNQECYDYHLRGACNLYKKCLQCKKVYVVADGKHECGDRFCRTCNVMHPIDRPCFIQPLKEDRRGNRIIRIAVYDFETAQDMIVRQGITMHEVAFVSLRWTCTGCNGNQRVDCEVCGTVTSRSWSWYTCDDPLDSFVEFLLTNWSHTAETVLFAHNGGRFDAHFVLQNMYRRKMAPDVVMTGLKVYQISVRFSPKHSRLLFRDSWLLMQTPLDALKKTFDLTCDEKHYFPYLFCCKNNMYKELDHLPDVSMYIPGAMNPEKHAKFMEWYTENKKSMKFCLQSKLAEYCENDTEILLQAVLAMRRILLEIAPGYDVTLKSTSIAGIAVSVFKKLFLKPQQICIVPEGRGFERNDKASDMAIKLMEWRSREMDVYIQHAGNGREYCIENYKVDGWIPDQDRVIEFLGCHYHSHPKCTEPDAVAPNGKLNRINYEETMHRIEEIRNMGYTVDIEWECDVIKELRANPEMRKFFEDYNTKGSIEPRDGFFGGRTGALKMYEEATEEKEISYYDIISLYPKINFDTKYPVGIPKVIRPENVNVEWQHPADIVHEGLYKVRIQPPKGLYLPVIPERVESTLMFALCITCAKKQNKNCCHNDKRRGWTATVTSIELREALRCGYRVTRCYRIWNFEQQECLFSDYVRTFLKIKVEASGYPAHLKTDKQKRKWIKSYKKKLGVDIDPDRVRLVPGLRHMAKILLNSLWGKFGQRNTLFQSKIFTNPADYFEVVLDRRIEISQIVPISDSGIRLTYRNKSAYIREHSNHNVVVALWTTSAARLKLLKFMQMVNEAPGCTLLYTDTDSIIFSHPRGNCPIQEGSFLGEMSKEYPDHEILEYVSGGPKQYALKLRSLKDNSLKFIRKFRGITLDKKNEDVLNYEKFKSMVLKDPSTSQVMFEYTRLGPDKTSRMLSRAMNKRYRTVNTKGFVNDLVVYPFGYQ